MAAHSSKVAEQSISLQQSTQKKKRFQSASALPFLLPALSIYLIFIIYPIISAFALSFFRWDGVMPQRDFVGLDNYIYQFTKDDTFWRAVLNTAFWVGLSLLIPTTFGLGLALTLNRSLAGKLGFRIIFYLPAIIASIAVATIWGWMYNPNFGIINGVLKQLGLSWMILPWLGDRNIAIFSVFAASVWSSTGPNMLLFLAGLQGVPQELIEAARVDGARRFVMFRNVLVPCMRETFIVVIALTIINSLKSFDLIYAMTAGGPGQASNVLASWTWFLTFNSRNWGGGMAVAMVLLAITMFIIVPYLWWVNRAED